MESHLVLTVFGYSLLEPAQLILYVYELLIDEIKEKVSEEMVMACGRPFIILFFISSLVQLYLVF